MKTYQVKYTEYGVVKWCYTNNLTDCYLSILDLKYNDLRELPNFKNIAPTLSQLTVTGNNLSRSQYTANYQLNNYLNNNSN